MSLVSKRSLESQDGLFTSILKFYETKAFFFFDLTQDILYYSIFSLNSAVILFKKWDKNLLFFLEIYGVAFDYVKENHKPVL